MADSLQRQKLREGVCAWNAWRRDNSNVTPELRDLELSLRERQLAPDAGLPINLSQACLDGANLRHARLVEASFKSASLVGADLSNARLDGADFTNADLKRAILDDADLAGAVLTGAILRGACLRRARNLTQEQIDQSVGDDETVLPPHLEVPGAWSRSRANDGGENGMDAVRAFLRDDPKDLYSTLRVSRKATEEDIREAFHKCVLVLHPDRRRGDHGTEDALKSLTVAAHILRDPKKRKAYDEGLIGADGKFTALGLRREKRRQLYRAAGYYFVAPVATGLSAVAVVGWMNSPRLSGLEVASLSETVGPRGGPTVSDVTEYERAKSDATARQSIETGVLGEGKIRPVARELPPTVEARVERDGPRDSPGTVQDVTVLSPPPPAEIPSTTPAEIGAQESDPPRRQLTALAPSHVERARESEAPAKGGQKAAKAVRQVKPASAEARGENNHPPATGTFAGYRHRASVKLTVARLTKLKTDRPKVLTAAQGKSAKTARPGVARVRSGGHAAAIAGWPSADDPFVDANGRVR